MMQFTKQFSVFFILATLSVFFLTGCKTTHQEHYPKKQSKRFAKAKHKKMLERKIAHFDKKMAALKEKGLMVFYPLEGQKLEKTLTEIKSLKKSGAKKAMRHLMGDFYELAEEMDEKLSLKSHKKHPQKKLAKIDPAKPAVTYTSYIVKAGDTLYSIARSHYGDASKWKAIFKANQGVLSSPEGLQVGQTLRLSSH